MQPIGKLFCYSHFLYFLLLQNSNLINTESSCELSFCFQSFLITENNNGLQSPCKKKLVLLLWSLLNFFFFKFQAHRYLKLKQSKDCFISYLFISLSAGPVIYPSQIAAARNSFLHFSIDLGASIIYAYKLSQQQILCKHVATLQLVQQSPRIHHRNRQMLNLNQLTGLLWEVRNKTQITFNH